MLEAAHYFCCYAVGEKRFQETFLVYLGEEGANGAFHHASADGTLAQ